MFGDEPVRVKDGWVETRRGEEDWTTKHTEGRHRGWRIEDRRSKRQGPSLVLLDPPSSILDPRCLPSVSFRVFRGSTLPRSRSFHLALVRDWLAQVLLEVRG